MSLIEMKLLQSKLFPETHESRKVAPAQAQQGELTATQQEGPAEVEGLVPELPRALRALANNAVATEDGPHPPDQVGSCRRQVGSIAILASRATRVP